jgi:peptide/nickel transport system permease protein
MTRALGYLVRRAAAGALVLALIVLISFALFFRIPTEPAAFLVDLETASPQEIQQARERLGVNDSVLDQFGHYVDRLAHGDLGIAWSQSGYDDATGTRVGQPVLGAVLHAAQVTGVIVLGGLVFLLLVAVPLGVLAARRPGGALDRIAMVFATTAIATHPLVVALLLQLFVARRWHVLPERGYCPFRPAPHSSPASLDLADTGVSTCSGPADWGSHLLLPWIVFGLFFMALYMRMTRSRMLETMAEPYIRTARAKGASEGRVIRRHALRNGMAPVVAMAAMDVGLAAG